MRKISESILQDFQKMLQREEMSDGTIKQYMHAVKMFRDYAQENEINVDLVLRFKKKLMEEYAVTTTNAVLAAVNRLFRYLQWNDCVVKACRIQKNPFREKERELSMEEYWQLAQTAEAQGNERMSLLLQTLTSTGIRISELKYITLEAAKAQKAVVTLKGKTRPVFLPKELSERLIRYAEDNGIRAGSIFVTRSGKVLDRSNVLHAMKKLSEDADVDEKKVFPHNFRHLFACQFYEATKDMVRLADILGHANINTTRIYTAVSWEEEMEQLDALRLVPSK